MSKNILFSTVLILISMSIFATTGFRQIKQESKIDSLRLVYVFKLIWTFQ